MYHAGLINVALTRVYRVGLPTAQRPVVDVGVADCLNLPLRTSSYDGVLCIAVLHHISSQSRRVSVLEEISRILVVNGRALVTVWAEEQENPSKTIEKWTPISESGDQGTYATCVQNLMWWIWSLSWLTLNTDCCFVLLFIDGVVYIGPSSFVHITIDC